MKGNWSHVRKDAMQFPGFEISIEVGSGDEEATAALVSEIQRVVMAKWLTFFPPPANMPPPCRGCGEGPK
jgi:hypothetical protein